MLLSKVSKLVPAAGLRFGCWPPVYSCLIAFSAALWLGFLSHAEGPRLPEDPAEAPGLPTSAREQTAADDEESSDSEAEFYSQKLRGRVVWMADALQDDFQTKTVPESKDRLLALRTESGDLHPILENNRGRAFRKDERLREMLFEMVVRRHPKHPMIQIVKLYELVDGKKFEVDYWCDICAIPMYETGPCACCQDHNRLRKREVVDDQ